MTVSTAQRVRGASIDLLGHPMRVHILLVMAARGWLSPVEFQHISGVSLNKSAYHFRVLREYEAIRLSETRPVRGATQHFYELAVGSTAVRALLISVSTAQHHKSDRTENITKIAAGAVAIKTAYSLEVDQHGLQELERVLGLHLPNAMKEIRRNTKRRQAFSQEREAVHLDIEIAASEARRLTDRT